MNFSTVKTTAFFSLVLVAGFSGKAFASDERDLRGGHEPHLHHQKGEGHSSRSGGGSSALLTYRGGNVLHANKTMAIFWGSEWSNASFAGDKISGLDQFFSGFSGSRYAGTGSEYSDRMAYVSNQSTYLGKVLDLSAAPRRALGVAGAIAEACKITKNSPDPNAVYFLYTSTGAGNVNYCAWHSWGNCSNGAPIQVAYMPRLDGIAGCDPQDGTTGHSEGLAAIANVTAHELLESMTDPRGTGWMDASGSENGDKCAWSFPSGNGVSTFANGSLWKVQMEWSNAAYKAGTGLANLNGQKACIY